MIRRLALFATILTAIVIVFGAYVRLSDAGLGCPDWPGCYGALSPHHAAGEISAAEAAHPSGPVSMSKAWKEMTHRYLASSLGVFIVAIAVLALRRRRRLKAMQQRESARIGLPLLVVGVVVVQGLLGKWTVTLLLKPAIVSMHLLGGMTVMSLLLWFSLRESGVRTKTVSPGTSIAAVIALMLVIIQIALGGWVSTNYAALACIDFPTCQASWVPSMAFSDGFHLIRELGVTADGERLPLAALTAIHWSHRLGAALIGAYLLWFASRIVRIDRKLGMALAFATVLQIGLGISNVVLKLPLSVAVAHNAGATLLLALAVTANYRLRAQAARPAERRLHEHLAA